LGLRRLVLLVTSAVCGASFAGQAAADNAEVWHWQSIPYSFSRVADIRDRTTGVWPGHVSGAASWWSSNSTTMDLTYRTASACGANPGFDPGWIKTCSYNYTNYCGTNPPNTWVACTHPSYDFYSGHVGSMLVRFDDVISGFTWTDATRRQTACHELGHTIGLDHRPLGDPTCMEAGATGNNTVGDTHDLTTLDTLVHDHYDLCCGPAQGPIIKTAIPLTVSELLLSAIGPRERFLLELARVPPH
jgi:hypothetical protein